MSLPFPAFETLRVLCLLCVRSLRWEAVHDSLDPCLHRGCAEVQYQSDWAFREAQVGVELAAVNWRQCLERLHFDDDGTVDDQICTISTIDLDITVDERVSVTRFESRSRLVHSTDTRGMRFQAGRDRAPDAR